MSQTVDPVGCISDLAQFRAIANTRVPGDVCIFRPGVLGVNAMQYVKNPDRRLITTATTRFLYRATPVSNDKTVIGVSILYKPQSAESLFLGVLASSRE